MAFRRSGVRLPPGPPLFEFRYLSHPRAGHPPLALPDGIETGRRGPLCADRLDRDICGRRHRSGREARAFAPRHRARLRLAGNQVGLGLNALFGFWWADSLAGLALTWWIRREANEALETGATS